MMSFYSKVFTSRLFTPAAGAAKEGRVAGSTAENTRVATTSPHVCTTASIKTVFCVHASSRPAHAHFVVFPERRGIAC